MLQSFLDGLLSGEINFIGVSEGRLLGDEDKLFGIVHLLLNDFSSSSRTLFGLLNKGVFGSEEIEAK